MKKNYNEDDYLERFRMFYQGVILEFISDEREVSLDIEASEYNIGDGIIDLIVNDDPSLNCEAKLFIRCKIRHHKNDEMLLK